MLPAPHLGGSCTGQDPRSKAHTAACLKSQSRAVPIETHRSISVVLKEWKLYHVMSLLALLLFYCITHGPLGSVLLVAVTVYQQPCCDLFFVITTDGASVCMSYVCALLSCTRHASMGCVLSQNRNTVAA